MTPNPKGFARESSTAATARGLAMRKFDPFFDSHWSWDWNLEPKKARQKPKARVMLSDVMAKILGL